MVATRFALAAHILVLLAGTDAGRGDSMRPATSSRLAVVVNTNPVVVRRITGQLARAGLIRVHRGVGGAELARPADGITLQDVWRAVHAGHVRPLVPLHTAGRGSDRTIHTLLADAFGQAETEFTAALGRTSLAQLARRLELETVS